MRKTVWLWGSLVLPLTLYACGSADADDPTAESGLALACKGSPRKCDRIQPSVAIASPASGTTVSGALVVAGTASDNDVVSRVELSVDGGAWAVAEGTSTWTASIDTTALADGPHTITARATDRAGNTAQIEMPVTTSNASSGQEPPSTEAPPSPIVQACLDRASKTVLSGTYTDRISISSPPDTHAVDARTAVSLTSGQRALEIGSSRTSDDLCVVGWTTIGQQARDLSWRYMHDEVGGSALRVYGSNYVVDGLRAENVEDGFDPRGGEGFWLRNAWMSYVRDDCIENDELRAGRVTDSLFDGCYTFFSEQETGSAEGESLIFEDVLVRLRPMPGPRGTEDPNVLGHGSFFKKFDYGGRHEPIIRDSVFFLEDDCYSGCKDWPAGTKATNVTIVWSGAGRFPMSVLPGMTLTTDRSIWDQAAATWKARHGCTSIDKACTKLHNPDPY